jgi:hypothetical protein
MASFGMVIPRRGDATMRAKMAGKLKGIVVLTDPLTPVCIRTHAAGAVEERRAYLHAPGVRKGAAGNCFRPAQRERCRRTLACCVTGLDHPLRGNPNNQETAAKSGKINDLRALVRKDHPGLWPWLVGGTASAKVFIMTGLSRPIELATVDNFAIACRLFRARSGGKAPGL